MITRYSTDKLTGDEILEYVSQWEKSEECKTIQMYKKYYELENAGIVNRYVQRKSRNKKPNNLIPTAYYKTVVDEMSGYMFNDVHYDGSEDLEQIMVDNNQPVKDMVLGTNALAYNRALELVYTIGDGEGVPGIKFSILDPLSVTLIFTDDIEPVLFCGIRKYEVPQDIKQTNTEIYYDVIYKDEWQYWKANRDGIIQRQEPRPLFFQEVPINYYQTQAIGIKSPFHQAFVYIDALDVLVSGNSDEIERLVDAILVIGTNLDDEVLNNMSEMKAIMDMKNDDRAEYLTKQVSPEFRKYVSQLLIQEIHKHCHVVDWYNPDTGITGEASGKALKTRMFDMSMYSQQLEKIYRDGAERRLRLISQVASIINITIDPDEIEIVYNRTLPSEFEDKLNSFKGAEMIIPLKKMWEGLGYDPDEIQELFDEQNESEVDLTPIEPPVENTEDMDDTSGSTEESQSDN